MKIITAIGSTTHIDSHNERMSQSALEGMAAKINRVYIPYLIEHDFERQIGILLFGKVVEMDDLEHALLIVIGEFESKDEFNSYPNGNPNTVWQNYVNYLDFVPQGTTDQEVTEINLQTIEQQLETYLDSTKIWSDGSVYRIKHFVAAVGDLQIHVWPKDHKPDHFHVISKQRNIDARFKIDTLEFLSDKVGSIRNKDIKKIQSFFQQRPDMLSKLLEEHAKMQ